MRDLQQAFVGDPNEFAAPPETVPPELRMKINLDTFKFDQKTSQSDSKFLDLLRGEDNRKVSKKKDDLSVTSFLSFTSIRMSVLFNRIL